MASLKKSLTNRWLLMGFVAVISSTVLTYGWPAGPQGTVLSSAPSSVSQQRALVDQYCVGCHNSKLTRGNLNLQTADLTKVPEHAELWERVVRKVRAGMMPPTGPLGAPRPDQATLNTFVVGLETELDRAAVRRPNIVPPGAHRLNRTEYANAVRDLLEVKIDPATLLPVDDSAAGFDNVVSALRMSAALMDAYTSAAARISRLALGAETEAQKTSYRALSDQSGMYHTEGLPLGTRGGMLVRHYFPADAEYDIGFQPVRSWTGEIFGNLKGEKIEITIDGERVRLWDLDNDVRPNTVDPKADANTVRVFVKAGMREVGATFLNTLYAPLVEDFNRHWDRRTLVSSDVGGFQFPPQIGAIDLIGPYNAMGAADSPARRKIFVCRPASAKEETACAEKILSKLVTNAFRRPSNAEDLEAVMTFYQTARERGGFEEGIRLALQRILSDPEFLYRIEREPRNVAPGQTYRITDLDLASRLSFFLWSSIPDDELIGLATKGKLRDPKVLDQQVKRMLADPRAEALAVNFAGQWLNLRSVSTSTPAGMVFPDFDDTLRQALRREAELFFDSVVREDRSVMNLLTADYTFVNERLAKHYRIPNIYGAGFRRVTLGPELDARRGLLGKGAILLMTSLTNRTSPVARGNWVITNLLGSRAPDPPPNVPELKPTSKQQNGQEGAETLSARERMEAHRSNAVCASCHKIMDPIGFALENFDATGAWRTWDANEPIDPSGIFADGTPMNGVTDLRNVLMKYSDQFARTVIEKLLVYAVGRDVNHYDMPALRSIVKSAARDDYRFSSIVLNIINSDLFQRSTKVEQAAARE
jgi:hypothetical protein